MANQQPISVAKLLLDTGNYRIVKQTSQKEARDAIIAEQGRKLVSLAKDIIVEGLSPIELTLVIDANDGQNNYTVVEGNRRLVTLQLLENPELAAGTALYPSFKKLNKDHADAIPKVLECVIAATRKAALVWIRRKHASGLEGAGTEPWQPMAKARADVEQGIARPELDAVNYVLTNPHLDPALHKFLSGSEFELTSLQRLVETKEVQQIAGFSIQNGKLVSDQSKERMQGILTEIIEAIATKKRRDGQKFTVRDIDSKDDREEFIRSVAAKHSKKTKGGDAWTISGTPTKVALRGAKAKVKATPSLAEQPHLIPTKFKLQLPAGKINDIFEELKGLDVTRRRYAVSVLFRVFFQLTLDDYIKKHGISLPKDNRGHAIDKMLTCLGMVTDHVKKSNLLSDKELKPINVAISDKDSFLSPETLNAYVHSSWMNPDPLQLKIAWANVQPFIECLWTSKK
ncbi:MAG TPA: hypothetical protein VKQ72_16975 [Aggregatilineales bacterium]|nr:hypothetical protein [Aggregatilineales bacterium]